MAQPYRPTARSGCDETQEQLIELAHDLETNETHILRREAWFYRGYLAYFSLEQCLEDADGNLRRISRIDVSEGAVRRHTFTDSSDLVGPPVELMMVPLRDRPALSNRYGDFLHDTFNNWDARCQRNIMSEDRLGACRALMQQIMEVTARRNPEVPRAALEHPCILALEDEEAIDITSRGDKYPQPYLLAVFYPRIGPLGSIKLAEFTSGPVQPDTLSVGTSVSIGMMLDSANPII